MLAWHPYILLAALALLAGCNASGGLSEDGPDASLVDTGGADTTDVGAADAPDIDGASTDVPDQADVPPEDECDPFSDDDECGCTDGVTITCFTGSTEARGVGECSHGTQTCVDGSFTECTGERVPTAEICDGLDQDCDGRVDEGQTNQCGYCGPDPIEVCGDLVDNDCNGLIDDPALGCDCDDRTNQPCYSGPAGTSGIGTCRGGIASCIDDAWTECAGEVLPGVEICDGADNDCDGLIDENVRNECGSCGAEPAELCDHLDNDCDGLADEGVRLPCGVCAGEEPPDEVCGDGFDNDCDGVVDDGCTCVGGEGCFGGDPGRAGVGQCMLGSRSCDSSGEFWTACEGYGLPSAEVCDELDNDCDGLTDVDASGCSVCGSAPEICNDIDDDCDGVVDEGTRNSCLDCLSDVVPEEAGPASLCNDLDDDCDGLVDEGLVNACGNCDESCYVATEDPDDGDIFDDGAELIPADDEANPTGRPGVTLSSQTFIPPYLWVANHTDNTMTRIHTERNAEEGRYWVAENPSRTAVDLDGNVWVAGRSDGRLTKVLWDPESCPDRNGNGIIDTSRPGNLGPLNSPADPFLDECVVFSQVMRAETPTIRGIAAGPDGRVWIGYSTGGVQWIDPNTLEIGDYVSSEGAPVFAPGPDGVYAPVWEADGTQRVGSTGGVYGLVVDSEGMLYMSSYNRTTMSRFDTVAGEWDALFIDYPCGLYGIALDGRNRVWTGGWPNCNGVGMFDPETGRAHSFEVPDGTVTTPGGVVTVSMPATTDGCGAPNYCVTGVGVEPATGDVWASFYAVGWTGRLVLDNDNLENSQWRFIPSTRDNTTGTLLPDISNDLRGVGFDRAGFAWTLGLGSGRVWKVDPTTERRPEELPNGVTVGVGTHYTYSDFTGSTALTFTAPRALWAYVFSAGYVGATIDAIEWEAWTPPETSAAVAVRVVDEDGVPLSDWVPNDVGFPYPGGAVDRIDLSEYDVVGEHFEVQITLATTDVDTRPIVHSVDMFWQRP